MSVVRQSLASGLLSAVILLSIAGASRCETVVLDARLHHLRSGSAREWDDFPQVPESDRLSVRFRAARNAGEQTIGLRHRDVKHPWRIRLNDTTLGDIPSDENDMHRVWAVPAGALRDGENVLTIEPNSSLDDDIEIGEIWWDDRPPASVTNQARIEARVTDPMGGPLPCRLTVVGADGSLAVVGTESNERLAIRTGMVYTADGRADFGVRPGKYTVFATRGPEYGLARVELEAQAEETAVGRLILRRQVDTAGYVACDTHVHTFTYSRHGDATIDERMLTLAGEGIELPIACDHNLHVDYEPTARRMRVRRYFTPVIGNEVTTRVGHFNIFPVADGSTRPPDHRSTDWNEILDGIFATPNVKVAILNHGRDLHSGFRPLDPRRHLSLVGENLEGRVFRANAMELINSAALQSDVMPLYRDWFGLLGAGSSVTPVGSSDSHEVARKLVGQGRTYIRCDDSDPADIDVEQACRAFLKGRVLVSMGLFTELFVDDRFQAGDVAPVGPTVKVTVRVRAPSWIRADRVVVYANGIPLRESNIEATPSGDKFGDDGTEWSRTWTIPRPAHDVHLVAVATGPGVEEPYWRIAKPYQPTSTTWKSYVVGSTGAIWLDVDRDGEATCARRYAERLMTKTDGRTDRLVDQLRDYDRVVAAHVAHLLAARNRHYVDADVQDALQDASEETRQGFREYYLQWRTGQEALAE